MCGVCPLDWSESTGCAASSSTRPRNVNTSTCIRITRHTHTHTNKIRKGHKGRPAAIVTFISRTKIAILRSKMAICVHVKIYWLWDEANERQICDNNDFFVIFNGIHYFKRWMGNFISKVSTLNNASRSNDLSKTRICLLNLPIKCGHHFLCTRITAFCSILDIFFVHKKKIVTINVAWWLEAKRICISAMYSLGAKGHEISQIICI